MSTILRKFVCVLLSQRNVQDILLKCIIYVHVCSILTDSYVYVCVHARGLLQYLCCRPNTLDAHLEDNDMKLITAT